MNLVYFVGKRMLGRPFTTRPLGFFIISLMFLCSSLQSTVADDGLPKGKDYPADHIYTGNPSEHLDSSDEFTNTFRTKFKDAIQGNVVFAGEFSQAEWGCGGSGCHVIAFINKRTGRALNHSFMAYDAGEDDNPKLIGEEITYIDKGSDLIVTHETSDSSEKKYYNYYLINKQKNGIVLIKKIQDTSH